MDDSPRSQTEEMIARWLAGELPAEEAERVERWMEEHAPPAGESSGRLPADVRERLRQPAPGRDELRELIAAIKAGPDSDGRQPDLWRSVLTPSDTPDVIGCLGVYEVLALIAQGGMGVVLEARDPVLGRRVAIKMLAPDLGGNAVARQRFLREARAAAALEHDHILPVHTVDDGPLPWFAMRLAEGGTLQDLLDAEGALPLLRVKSLALQIASALEAAHAAGLVHRDIKPANILLDATRERAWLADFGIARAIADPSLTYRGFVTGTPNYMSPEQAAGALVDERSDLFSLGAVLHHCATGRVPFDGATSVGVLRKVASAEQTPLRRQRSGLPAWFLRMLDTLMAREPADRFRSASHVIDVLRRESAPLGVRARRRRWFGGLAAAFVLSLAAALAVPTVRTHGGRLLAKVTGRLATIDGRLAAYSSLKKAIEAARDGDTIVLRAGDVPVDIVDVPAGRRLTLRGAPGERPRLVHANAFAQIVCRSPVTIEGVDFAPAHALERHSPGLLVLHAAGNVVRDVTFTARHEPPSPQASERPSSVQLTGGGTVRLERCWFSLENISAVMVRDVEVGDPPAPAGEVPPLVDRFTDGLRQMAWLAGNVLPATQAERVAFVSCVVTGARAVELRSVRHEGAGLVFDRTLVFSDAVVSDAWTHPFKPVHVHATGTVFAPRHTVFWCRGERADTVRELLTWQGNENLFRAGVPFFSAAVVPDRTPRQAVAARSAWLARPAVIMRGSREAPVQLTPLPPDPLSLARSLSGVAPPAVLATLRELTQQGF